MTRTGSCSGQSGCTCGCCEGLRAATPVPAANPPGRSSLAYRVGSYATFFETMLANLTLSGEPQLQRLGTRQGDDAAIALLDSWAVVGDILTFYQERIANEGYLRTAVQRRSVLELARLIGYRVRPGVAASVYLAFTIDPTFTDEALIPAGTRANSIPGPGESQQTFETSEQLTARAAWNLLQPRMSRPQSDKTIGIGDESEQPLLYVAGVSANLKPNDMVLYFSRTTEATLFRVFSAVPDTLANRTAVSLLTWQDGAPAPNKDTPVKVSVEDLARNTALFKNRSIQPANATRLSRALSAVSPNSEASFALFDTFNPENAGRLVAAVKNATLAEVPGVQAFVFRVKATLFASNLPGPPTTTISTAQVNGGGGQVITTQFNSPPTFAQTAGVFNTDNTVRTLALDAEYPGIVPGSFLVLDYPLPSDSPRRRTRGADRRLTAPAQVEAVETRTLSFGGVSTKVTLVTVKRDLKIPDGLRENPAFLRGAIVYAQTELLPLAEVPVADPICGSDQEIELDALYEGLEAGRWLVIDGERTDIEGTAGVRATELVMLSGVRHGTQEVDRQGKKEPLPGERLHTFIRLASGTAYCYKRDNVRIYGNVAHATHGETRREQLGSGDGSKPFQQFTLKQQPLTHVSAPTTSGIESSLQVYVNDVRWRESLSIAGLQPYERKYITKTGDDGKTTVTFGDGVRGSRVPSGIENIRAVYRSGIGKGGNVRAAQISVPGDRPLGLQGVVNPLPASGGADPESRDQARRNAPLALTALDRLVSVQDYADFARTFAGIGKAAAVEMSDGTAQVVHVTIAGLDDIDIPPDSDLYRNLKQALVKYGDPVQAIRLALRDRILLVISAGVKVLPDYLWEKVEPKVRSTLLERFAFDRRELGQDAVLSEAIAAMQSVEGVEYVDVDSFGGVVGLDAAGNRLPPSEIAVQVAAIAASPAKPRVPARGARRSGGVLLPAQVAYFAPDQAATLVLNEVKS